MTDNDMRRWRVISIDPQKKIQAIKEIRAASGLDLKTAKYVVDDVAAGTQREIEAPANFDWNGYVCAELLPVRVDLADLVEVLAAFPQHQTVGDLVGVLRVARDMEAQP